MREVDARGLACPQPVILTRKTWLESSVEPLLVRVDNPVARDNVSKLAQSLGCTTEVKEIGTEFQIMITKGESGGNQENQPQSTLADEQLLTSLAATGCGCGPVPSTGTVILFKNDVLGEGSRELGQVLMKSFLYTLRELHGGIEALIFMNSGVYLACAGSDSLEHLEQLANEAVEIYVCGTCLNFFNLQDQLKVGTISNMYSIWEVMKGAAKVISL